MKHLLVLLLVCVGDLFCSTTSKVSDELCKLGWRNGIHGDHIMNSHCRESMYEAEITEGLRANARKKLADNRQHNLDTCIQSVKMLHLFGDLMAFKANLDSGSETEASLKKETLVGLGLVDRVDDEIGNRASQVAIHVVKQLLIPRLEEVNDYESFQSKIIESLSEASTHYQKSFYKRILAYYSCVKCLVRGDEEGYKRRYDAFYQKVIGNSGSVCSFTEEVYQKNGDAGLVHTGYNVNVKLQVPLPISCYYINLGTRQWSKLEDETETSYVCINLHKNDRQIHSMYPVAHCVYQNPELNGNAAFCLHLAEELGIQDNCVEQLRSFLETGSEPQ